MIVSNSSLLVFASVMGRWPRSGHWDARSPKESFRKSFYLPDMVMSEHSASNAVAGYSLKESWHEQWWGKPQDLYRWCKWPDGCHCYPSSSALLSETITFMSDSLEFDSWLITEHNTLMLNLELQSRLVITDLRWIFSVPSRQNVQFSRAERAGNSQQSCRQDSEDQQTPRDKHPPFTVKRNPGEAGRGQNLVPASADARFWGFWPASRTQTTHHFQMESPSHNSQERGPDSCYGCPLLQLQGSPLCFCLM